MSDHPPPIPQKNKHKCLYKYKHSIYGDKTTKDQSIPESPLQEDIVNHNLHEIKSPDEFLASIHKLNDEYQQLRVQDQKLMRTFLLIREEIQLLDESDVMNKPYAVTTNHSGLSSNTLIKEAEYQNTEKIIVSFLQASMEKGNSEKHVIATSKLYSHFNIPHLSNVIDEFRCKYALSANSIQNCENHIIENINPNIFADNIESLNPPPVPEKRTKRHLVDNFIPSIGQHIIMNNESFFSNDQSLVSDPVLNQDWPRSKSFNSNAFLSNHNRQSSMTLSDFYDHLNPIPNTRDQLITSKRNTFKEPYATNPDIEQSPNQNSIINKPLKLLPTSKSNYDCKISSLESFGHQDSNLLECSNYRKNVTRLICEPVDCHNVISSCLNFDSNDGQLSRAGSTPSLFSRSVFLNSSMDQNQEKSVENSISFAIGNTENSRTYSLDKSPNPYFKSKSPKKFFSILSRGISSGFNKNIEKNSTNLDTSVVFPSLHKNDVLFGNTSPNNDRLISILTPVIEHPPPIPPKSQKPNDSSKIDLQQTWC